LNLKIKVLMMDPESEAAKFRNYIETDEEKEEGNIARDITDALVGIKSLNKINGKDFIEYLLYSSFPQTGFTIVDSSIFVEPYHYAPTQKFIDALIEKGNAAIAATKCTGGRIPVLQFENDSNMYIAMEKHFDSIWEYEKRKKQGLFINK